MLQHNLTYFKYYENKMMEMKMNLFLQSVICYLPPGIENSAGGIGLVSIPRRRPRRRAPLTA